MTLLPECTSQFVTSKEMNQMIETNQNKIFKQIYKHKVKHETNPANARKVKCTHCKNYMYM